jgi:double-stranded uracil-DNA glycosylase
VPPLAPEALPLALHRAQRPLAVGTVLHLDMATATGGGRLDALLTGAGFDPLDDGAGRTDGSGDAGAGRLQARVVRARTLADTVGPGMRLLVCGVNPSPYSADAGVGYARPGNRYWPAALAAGLVDVDRDPVAALARGVGMTDFAKRPTRTAAEVTREEYESGFARVSALVRWLAPGAVCFVGLSGWRAVVDRAATAGRQEATIAGRPVYVMPSTSGLNARSSLADLAGHLAAAAALG